MPTIMELIEEKQREQARIAEIIGKLEDALSAMKQWANELGGDGRPQKKILEMVETVMKEAKTPMKPPAIAERIREKFDFIPNRQSIGTMLHREVTRTTGKKTIFTKEPGATNTYGLKEWERK